MRDESYSYGQSELDEVHLSGFRSHNETAAKSQGIHRCIILITKRDKRGDDVVDLCKEIARFNAPGWQKLKSCKKNRVSGYP